MALTNGRGEAIALGKAVGRGGEGVVYEVIGQAGIVVKIYHTLPDNRKQAKLRYMAAHASASLRAFTSWPLDTVHQKSGGPVVGILMPHIKGCVPIHNLYSPAHRKQMFPQADWAFLLTAARNLAAAFNALHSEGHILGDVNQGNVLVERNAKVLLIDSDSFQITTPNEIHRCGVGVTHFTPPELQGIQGFSGVTRTEQHDAFGLALLIFHLLFGGRHPYAGIPLINEAGNALEDDIKALRFAYSRDASSRGVSPPPRSIPISLIPTHVEGMFRYAFTEPGTRGQRPKASDWVTVLDGILCNLARCRKSQVHTYPPHCSSCPWCELNDAGVIYFVDVTQPLQTGAVFDLAAVWGQIDAIPCPQSPTASSIAPPPSTPRPLPEAANRTVEIVIARVAICVLAVGLSVLAPSSVIFILLVAWVAFVGVGTIGEQERAQERKERDRVLRDARATLASVELQAKSAAGVDVFGARKNHLLALRNEYAGLRNREQADLTALASMARSRQLQGYLGRYFIEDADIPGVGPAKKSSLRSFGIETAADVEWDRVYAVKGFGTFLTSAVMQWRTACEAGFRFDPQVGVPLADKQAVVLRFAQRRKQVEEELIKGIADLRTFHQQGQMRASVFRAQLEAAAAKVSQAEADMSVFV